MVDNVVPGPLGSQHTPRCALAVSRVLPTCVLCSHYASSLACSDTTAEFRVPLSVSAECGPRPGNLQGGLAGARSMVAVVIYGLLLGCT